MCCLHAAVHAHAALGELVPANWGCSPGCRNGGWEGMKELLGAEKCSPSLPGSGGRLLSESERNTLGNASCWGSLSQLAAPANQDGVLSGGKERVGSSS